MNAFNNVNQAAACILTDTETASELGIPQDRWIYPAGGAGYHDSKDCETRTACSWSFHTLIPLQSGYVLISIRHRQLRKRLMKHCNQLVYGKKRLISLMCTRMLLRVKFYRLLIYLCRCFPIVPKLVCQHLGFPIDDPPKPMTLLGGLTSFGGAGNNYSMHVSFTSNALLVVSLINDIFVHRPLSKW